MRPPREEGSAHEEAGDLAEGLDGLHVIYLDVGVADLVLEIEAAVRRELAKRGRGGVIATEAD